MSTPCPPCRKTPVWSSGTWALPTALPSAAFSAPPSAGGSIRWRAAANSTTAADEGAAIAAFADGTVYATGESSSLGRYIMLQHEGGYITLYAHCSKVTATGGQVSMGDKIAEVGSTGLATGPHLHFELHDGSLYLNPIFYVELG